MSKLISKEIIVREARRWIKTPYRHQASICGHGADCLGLIRGVWRECIGSEPQSMPEYSSDWGEVGGRENMLETARKWFEPVDFENAQAGDLILFRWKNASIVKHAGILTKPMNEKPNFIHAYEKAGVVETTLGSQWKSRVAACFKFPISNR